MMQTITIELKPIETFELEKGAAKDILIYDKRFGLHFANAVRYQNTGKICFWPEVDAREIENFSEVIYWAELPVIE